MESVVNMVEAVHWPAALYLAMSASVIVLEPLASPNNSLAPRWLKTIIQTFLGFGKTLPVKPGDNSLWLRYCTVPKSWFRHFYVVSGSLGVLSCCLLWGVYALRLPPPPALVRGLDLLTTPTRAPAVSSLCSIVCTALLTAQCLARLHECYRVSVFSSGGAMNVVQYFVGFAHYTAAYTILLSHTPALVHDSLPSMAVSAGEVALCLASVAVFGAAFILQRDTMRRLARLRTSTTAGGVYGLPRGGGFEHVSCPHMAAEVVMYGALTLLQRNIIWGTVMLFVASNQVHVALSNHRWYQTNFKDYPNIRTAIIPKLL